MSFLYNLIQQKWFQITAIALVLLLFIMLTCNTWLTGQYRLKYQQGYNDGYADGFTSIDTTYITDTISVVDTLFLPAELDSTQQPYVASARIKLDRNGYVDVQYVFPPVNAFSPVYVRMPDAMVITKPIIQHKIEYKLDWQKGCLAGAGGFVIGAGAIIALIYSLK